MGIFPNPNKSGLDNSAKKLQCAYSDPMVPFRVFRLFAFEVLVSLLFFVNLPAMEKSINNRLIRCPKLGDEITFPYCLQESGRFPCARIVSCWSPFFDVESCLKETMEQENWDIFISSKPSDKITGLIDLIEAAKAKK